MGDGWKTQPKSLLLRPFKASTTYIYTTAVLWWQTLILFSYPAEREAIGEERRDMDLIIVDFMIIRTNDSRCQVLEDPVACFSGFVSRYRFILTLQRQRLNATSYPPLEKHSSAVKNKL